MNKQSLKQQRWLRNCNSLFALVLKDKEQCFGRMNGVGRERWGGGRDTGTNAIKFANNNLQIDVTSSLVTFVKKKIQQL